MRLLLSLTLAVNTSVQICAIMVSLAITSC
uniref:Uncharacterized protein n=1 Tax=Anguilla anguilla TaxID=7936 RepID=A0A0E9VUG8_ANGAN